MQIKLLTDIYMHIGVRNKGVKTRSWSKTDIKI